MLLPLVPGLSIPLWPPPSPLPSSCTPPLLPLALALSPFLPLPELRVLLFDPLLPQYKQPPVLHGTVLTRAHGVRDRGGSERGGVRDGSA